MLPELLLPKNDNHWEALDPTSVRQSYALGRALREVGREPCLGKNERLVALAMYMDAVHNETLPDLSQVTRMGQLSEAATVKALKKLTVAGFVKVVRHYRDDLSYEVQFPDDCDVS